MPVPWEAEQKRLKLEVSGARDDYRSRGTGGIIRPGEGDLGFPRSHTLPSAARSAATKLRISQSHRTTSFQQKGR